MLSLSDNNQDDVIEAFNFILRDLDCVLMTIHWISLPLCVLQNRVLQSTF